ncbi:SRPBCC family protein [Sciscionella marina]|uniref:SRPBCC family protein n=1 Tax=Sciscionella marina TaxID=508770 RepID=UPI00037ACE43|nr:SRPBCC family protein [Sciscionella marina]
MLTVQVTETIDCAPDELLTFVTDIERYAEIDRKIRPVHWVRRAGDYTEFGCRGHLAGIPTPKVVQWMRLTPGQRVDIGLAGPPRNRLTRMLAEFTASFEVTATEAGRTRLVRTLNFTFWPPLRRIAEPLLRERLTAEVHEEVALAKQRLEG